MVVPVLGEAKSLRAEKLLATVEKTELYTEDLVRLSKELEGKTLDDAINILSKEKVKNLASNLTGSLKTIYDDLIKYGYKTTDDGAEIIFKNADNLPIAKISDDALHIKIPYDNGWATQSKTTLSSTIYNTINTERKVYRLGRLNVSQAGEAQYWSPENPMSFSKIEDYAEKYGVPIDRLKGNDKFIIIGEVQEGAIMISRPAVPYGGSSGGGIEIVTTPTSVKMESFHTLKIE